MDAHLRKLAAGQDDLVAAWQLAAVGWTRKRILHHAHHDGWRRIHHGVFALGQAPLTQRQVWIAAVLTAPNTYLAGHSATHCWGFHEPRQRYEVVVRPGHGGKRWLGSLLVARSTTLKGQTTRRDGIPIVTAERALVDVAAGLKGHQLGRAFRESIRLKTTTANQISKVLAGQRGTAVLVDLCDRYATIPYHRCRSDAESRALEVLHDAGVMAPRVNVRVGGCEADLVWRDRKLVVEIDGDQFHRFPDEDARKEAAWRGVGYTVRRVPSDDVYYRPERLLAQVSGQIVPL
ncbi:MAG: endonuclease domain-containing protein [Solirubrobacteraceae bacterium]